MTGAAPPAEDCCGAAPPAEDCCAICFEQRPFISLPCACRVSYCASCWDRALATSVAVRRRAQCPSCRTALRIDFEPETGGLVFARDVDGAAPGSWKARLKGQVRPAQIKLLQSFGTSLASRTGACSLPACVCGARLEHVGTRERILRMLEAQDASWRARAPRERSHVERLMMASSPITCDLCGQNATRSGALWTCRNGTKTVLHPNSYDVCEPCFVRYAGSQAETLLQGRDAAQPSWRGTCLFWRRRRHARVVPADSAGGDPARRSRCFAALAWRVLRSR